MKEIFSQKKLVAVGVGSGLVTIFFLYFKIDGDRDCQKHYK